MESNNQSMNIMLQTSIYLPLVDLHKTLFLVLRVSKSLALHHTPHQSKSKSTYLHAKEERHS